jgi:hypothetical protein
MADQDWRGGLRICSGSLGVVTAETLPMYAFHFDVRSPRFCFVLGPDALSDGMTWPYTIPAGLRRRLEAVLSQRSHGAPEIWGEVRDWLVEQGVARPEGVQPERPSESAQRDQ